MWFSVSDATADSLNACSSKENPTDSGCPAPPPSLSPCLRGDATRTDSEWSIQTCCQDGIRFWGVRWINLSQSQRCEAETVPGRALLGSERVASRSCDASCCVGVVHACCNPCFQQLRLQTLVETARLCIAVFLFEIFLAPMLEFVQSQ